MDGVKSLKDDEIVIGKLVDSFMRARIGDESYAYVALSLRADESYRHERCGAEFGLTRSIWMAIGKGRDRAHYCVTDDFGNLVKIEMA